MAHTSEYHVCFPCILGSRHKVLRFLDAIVTDQVSAEVATVQLLSLFEKGAVERRTEEDLLMLLVLSISFFLVLQSCVLTLHSCWCTVTIRYRWSLSPEKAQSEFFRFHLSKFEFGLIEIKQSPRVWDPEGKEYIDMLAAYS